MVFDDYLPKIQECICNINKINKMLHIKWIIILRMGQCGDGTIYRADGFQLVGIRANSAIYEFPGRRIASLKCGR